MTNMERVLELRRTVERINWKAVYGIIDEWEAHCLNAGHKPVSQGGTATYTTDMPAHDGDEDGPNYAVCLVESCHWFTEC